jgi:hypothetical protein
LAEVCRWAATRSTSGVLSRRVRTRKVASAPAAATIWPGDTGSSGMASAACAATSPSVTTTARNKSTSVREKACQALRSRPVSVTPYQGNSMRKKSAPALAPAIFCPRSNLAVLKLG